MRLSGFRTHLGLAVLLFSVAAFAQHGGGGGGGGGSSGGAGVVDLTAVPRGDHIQDPRGVPQAATVPAGRLIRLEFARIVFSRFLVFSRLVFSRIERAWFKFRVGLIPSLRP